MLEVEFSIFHCFQILDVIFGQKFAIFQKSSKVNCKQAIIFNGLQVNVLTQAYRKMGGVVPPPKLLGV